MLGNFWTLANALSLIRLILVVPITYLILEEGPFSWLLGLVVLAAVTDWFDGRVARWSHTVSEWGKVLDPLADKVASALIVMALVVQGFLPEWLLGLILFRDLGILVCGFVLAKRTGQIVMSAWAGKVAIAALALTCVAALMQADPPVLRALVWGTAALLVYSQALYLFRFFRLMRRGPRPKAARENQASERVRPPVEQEAGMTR